MIWLELKQAGRLPWLWRKWAKHGGIASHV